MIAGSVSRRYAKALLSIGIDQNSTDAFGRELEQLAEVFEMSPDLRDALSNPVFPQERRRAILDEIARRLALSKTVHTFVLLLLEKNRVAAVPAIARAHRALVDEHAGRIRATVTTARPLEAGLEQRLKTALEKQSGKIVILEKREDPGMIGGIVTQLGDTLYDGSVRNQLANLRAELLAE